MGHVFKGLVLASLTALPVAAQTAGEQTNAAGAAVATTGATPAPEAAAQTASGGAPEGGAGAAVATGQDDDDDAAGAAAAPAAAGQPHDYGPAGIMVKSNRTDLPPLTLASGKPVASGPYTLKSGGFYRIDIEADGSAELALSGGDFFRAIWVNEVVINDIEIRPLGLHSLEFDDAGTASISFVAITPGRYTLSVPGTSGESQRAEFVIQ